MINVKVEDLFKVLLNKQICRITYSRGNELKDVKGSVGELRYNKDIINREISVVTSCNNTLIILL